MKKIWFVFAILLAGCATQMAPTYERISPGSERAKAYGPTVVIRSIQNLDPGPVEHVLAKELARGGYSLVSDGRPSSYGGYGLRGAGWDSYFPRTRGRNYGAGGCDSCARADYFLEVGARPVGGAGVGLGTATGRYGYGTSARGQSFRNEVEIYLTFYDGRTGRAVPGKSARARIRIGSFGAVAGEILTRALGVDGFGQRQTYDPVTEAAVRTIPQLIESEGRN